MSKGKTNNPAGRPKGTPNRIGAELRERVIAFVEERWEQLERDFDDLEPRERMMFIEKLMAYTLPKLQAVAVDYREHNQPEAVTVFRIPDNGRSFDPGRMTDEELRWQLANIEEEEKRKVEIGPPCDTRPPSPTRTVSES